MQKEMKMKFNLTLYLLRTPSSSSLPDRRQERAPDLHAAADAGAGEGVPLQPLRDAAAPLRDRAEPGAQRAADQDLVPEPADEVEERTRHELQHDQPSGTDAQHVRLHRLVIDDVEPTSKQRRKKEFEDGVNL